MIAKKGERRKREWDEIFCIFLIVVFNVAIIIFLLIGNVKLYVKKSDVQAQLIDLEEEIKVLESKNMELEEMFLLASSGESVEKIIREKGLYKKEGEEVVVVVREEGEEELAPTPENFFQKVLGFFRNLISRD